MLYVALPIEPCYSNEKNWWVKGRPMSPHTLASLKELDEKPWLVRNRFADRAHVALKVPKDYSIVFMVRLKRRCPHYDIDYAWNERLNNLLLKYLHLETSMWNLSTLGGAFSSMGDFIDDFAKRAFRVSLRQRQIAWELDDPILISRCNMYIALSLAQLNHFVEARQILRAEYHNAKQLKSTFLLNCAKGNWVKIRQIYKRSLKGCET